MNTPETKFRITNGNLVRKLIQFNLLLLLSLNVACRVPLAPTLTSQQNLSPKDYPHVLKLWTKKDNIYLNFEHKMEVHVTFMTPMLRSAFGVRFPEIYGYGSQITKQELVDMVGNREETFNFFVSVYTPQDKWNDLEKKDSIWHISLSKFPKPNSLEEESLLTTDAVSIDRIKMDENLRNVFPYVHSFAQVYIVRFPTVDYQNHAIISARSMSHTFLRMRIASSMGAATMTWKIIP